MLQPKLDKQLKELVEPDCCTRDLDLSQRSLGPEAAWSVAVAIAHNVSVFRLDLRRNRPETKGIKVRWIACARQMRIWLWRLHSTF